MGKKAKKLAARRAAKEAIQTQIKEDRKEREAWKGLIRFDYLYEFVEWWMGCDEISCSCGCGDIYSLDGRWTDEGIEITTQYYHDLHEVLLWEDIWEKYIDPNDDLVYELWEHFPDVVKTHWCRPQKLKNWRSKYRAHENE